MGLAHGEAAFQPLDIAVLTVSDTRTLEDDRSGGLLAQAIADAGHRLAGREIVPDDVYRLRAVISAWIADPKVQAIVTTGGTGFTARDSTPEAVLPLLDKVMDGFGELFRALSFQEIGTATLESRAVAGIANGTLIFCLPGSSGACRTGWEKIIGPQLDVRTPPCNLAAMFPRFLER
jgi:molybdenum cofactor biosynthesis protein B